MAQTAQSKAPPIADTPTQAPTQSISTPHPRRWSDDRLLAARQLTDPLADQLVHDIFSHSGSDHQHDPGIEQHAYNHLLDITDKLLEAPELALVQTSAVAQELQCYPQALTTYYEPIEAPDWVDTDKLKIASDLWADNLLAIIGVLYSGSLPSCYLIHNGVPALYQSSKLKEPRYIYQRIYETGRFLDDVLSAGGLQVINDLERQDTGLEHYQNALNHLDPDGGWTRIGKTLVRSQDHAPTLDPQHVAKTVRSMRSRPKRYLWGKGYIATKKVRFLHATMRYMLTHRSTDAAPVSSEHNPASVAESLFQPALAWDEAAWGKPINQEDLAFTLLTFGYVIPHGLAKWGCYWTQEEQEAFLHLWKTVGHILGLQEDLMTDSWDEAESLFQTLRQQQAGPSEEGQRLTDALIQFLQDYLPTVFDRHVPALLIRSQLGASYANMILSPQYREACRSLVARFAFSLFIGLVRAYFGIRTLLFHRFPTLATFMGDIFSQAGEALIDSWRDVYARRPFYLPLNVYTWTRKAGVRDDFVDHLKAWRSKLFSTIAWAIALLIGSSAGLLMTSLLLMFGYIEGAQLAAGATLGSFLSAIGVFKLAVPRISRQRPTLSDADGFYHD